MKFILTFSICSAITGFCDNPLIIEKPFNSWTECVGYGGAIITDFAITMKEHAETGKLFVSYFCTEQTLNSI